MNGIKFIRQNGGLARKIAGDDHVSGLIVYGDVAFEKNVLLSIDELPSLGVTETSHPVLHYHVSEFYRMSPGAKLYIQSVAVSDGNYSEVKVLQNFAEGSIKQLAICDYKSSVSQLTNAITTLNALAVAIASNNTPLSILLSMKVATADMLTLPNLHLLKCDRVSVVLGQDAGGRGSYLKTLQPSHSFIGTVLGALASANVHESIEWVEKFNMVTTAYPKQLTGGSVLAREMDIVGFCDGSLARDYTQSQIASLHDKGYIFGIKHVGTTGTYFNSSATAGDIESDFLYIENNRTIDKAIRQINKKLLPKLSGPAYIDADSGFLRAETVSGLEALAAEPLDQMMRDAELSGYSVTIDPTQQVLRTSKLEVLVKLIPVGVLRNIEVKIGLTLKK
ncbi:DUF2586 family protein [Flavobacterium columnare]|uniref:DUF2586 family protein n=1 Tax=Flavobacterium columnare TaxID=996 RepID=UPI000B5BF325|nr:hypothetical protein B0A56_00465 [Flavobacterium columnare NBRC 100251 = ATCC 23463]